MTALKRAITAMMNCEHYPVGTSGKDILCHRCAAAAIEAAEKEARAEERNANAATLDKMADNYEFGGEPGPLGFNCWGYRTIAATFRDLAATIRARGTT